MAITAAESPAHYNTSLEGPITETEAPMPDYGTGSFLISSIANPASTRLFVGNLTMHSEAPNAAPGVPELVDDVVGGDRSTGTSILEFAVENHPNNSSHSPGDEGPEKSITFVYELGSDDGYCATGQTSGDGSARASASTEGT
jgi:hypothetical protein